MTDREQLEAAAKAAGYTVESFTADGGCWAYVASASMNSDDEPPIFKFHPLEDDGDCARLEATLMLHVEWHPATETVYVGTAELGCTKPWGDDRQSARRAAAVRAAAAMARA